MKNNTFNVHEIRKDFPILNRKINGKPLIYFDNAATTQKPLQVIDAISDYYSNYNANIHRGIHQLSQEATDKYEGARKIIQSHFNAKHSHEIIITPGATHSINLVAHGFRALLKKDDIVLVSEMEHHSNIVPWQMLCKKTSASLKVIPMTNDGELDMNSFESLLKLNPKLVFVNHVSNSLGTINPIKNIIKKAHEVGAAVLIDGAQACSHIKIDVQSLGADFYVTSAHKMCGPTGVGMLYAKEVWLNQLPPYQGGGEMIDEVTFDNTTYADLPHKFEAGTPNVCGGIAFGTAIDYLNSIGFDNIVEYENKLLEYATKRLLDIEGLKIYGTSKSKTSVISFNIDGVHAYDLGTIIDKIGIAVRTGQHCTQPIMDFFGIDGTARVSFAFYNTKEEIDQLILALKKAKLMLI